MTKDLTWQDVLDGRNQALHDEIASRIPIELRPSGNDGWTSEIKDGRAQLGYADTQHPHASATHELLHFKLEVIHGVTKPFLASDHEEVTTEDIGYLYNQLCHHKMFAEFVGLGFPAADFLADSDETETRDALEVDVARLEEMGARGLAFLFPYVSTLSPHDTRSETAVYRERLRALVAPSFWRTCDRIFEEWAGSHDWDIRVPMAQLFRLIGRTRLALSPTGEMDDAISPMDVSLPPVSAPSNTSPMFENVARVLSEKMHDLSRGALHCLPYSRALLDLFDALHVVAAPLVVRCIVFNPQATNHLRTGLDIQALCEQVTNAPYANGSIVRSTTNPMRRPAYHREVVNEVEGRMVIPYRTIGVPARADDGDRELGSYSSSGGWLGHLVVMVAEVMIDMTIGQIESSVYGIHFSVPYLTAMTSAEFREGRAWLPIERDGNLICYRAYPDETTYDQSEAWGAKQTKVGRAPLRKQLRELAGRVAKLFEGDGAEPLH